MVLRGLPAGMGARLVDCQKGVTTDAEGRQKTGRRTAEGHPEPGDTLLGETSCRGRAVIVFGAQLGVVVMVGAFPSSRSLGPASQGLPRRRVAGDAGERWHTRSGHAL
jgi:hypothetical protein